MVVKRQYFVSASLAISLFFACGITSALADSSSQSTVAQMEPYKAASMISGEGAATVDDDPIFGLALNVSTPEDYAAAVIDLINEQRAIQGIDPLQVHWAMRELAETRAEELSQSFDKVRPNGTLVKETHKYGEIRSMDQSTPNAFVNSLMDSYLQQTTILDESYIHAGAGCYQDDNGTYYWVVLFSRK